MLALLLGGAPLVRRARGVVGLRTRGGFDKANGDHVIPLHHGNSRLAFRSCRARFPGLRPQTGFKIPSWKSPLVCRRTAEEDNHGNRSSHYLAGIGAIAGWLAGLLVKGYGFGVVGNIVVGIAGAIIAGWLLPQIGFVLAGGILAAIVNAVIGAVILLLVIGFIRRAA